MTLTPLNSGVFAVLAAALLFTSAAPCVAQPSRAADAVENYPVKALRVIVGFPPGGPVDLQARVIMQKLSAMLGQPIVIESRAGADGALGADAVAKSAPDGYTLLYGSGSHVINGILRGKALPYDPIRDFTAIGMLTKSAYLLLAHPSLPARNVTQLVALARARPGALSYGSSGSGSMPHLAGEYLKLLARIDIVHIPYKGAAPSLSDTLGGQIPLTIVGPPPAMPHIKTGKIRLLAVTTATRAAALPEAPTVAEAGFPDYDVGAMYGGLAPARTPAPIVQRLNRELVSVLAMTDVRERLAQLGLEPAGGTPQEHEAYMKKDLLRWPAVVKAAGMRVD